MALPKKGLRKINVDNVIYVWNTTGNDGWISLSIIPMMQQNRLITATFDYHSKVTDEWISPNGYKGEALKQQIMITGYIVRQVISHAIKIGWDPMGDVAVLNLGAMDNKIDIRVEPE